MDAAAQLALMLKASDVFGGEDTLLSFPVVPLAFEPRDLDLLGDPTLSNIIEFSGLVNHLPNGTEWRATDPTRLWDVYRRVLTEATYANSTRTASEEAAYQAARGVLFTTDADGMHTPSARGLAYKVCRDQYRVLEQEYLARKSTAEAATDAAERGQWKDVVEPEMRRDLEEALQSWETEGYRSEVDDAEATVQHLGARSPQIERAEWLSRINGDVTTLTRASDQSVVYPTSFAPENALDEGSWRLFTMSGAEVKALAAQAPTDLRERLTTTASGPAISSMSFEFSSATLIRPWFSPDLFKARFWRFADSSLVVSSGSPPSAGLCPAYAVAVVFARRIRVQSVSTSASTQGASGPLRLDVALVRGVSLRAPGSSIAPRRPSSHSVVGGRGGVRIATTRPSNTAAFAKAVKPTLARAPSRLSAARASSPSLSAFQGSRYLRPTLRTAVAPPGSSPQRVEAVSADQRIQILAFVCRKVGRCPDPDPSLAW